MVKIRIKPDKITISYAKSQLSIILRFNRRSGLGYKMYIGHGTCKNEFYNQ